jgi:MFS family permease
MSADPAQGPRPHQFRLMRERRFAPFFWAMFLGAFNDNLFKNAFAILVAFQGAGLLGLAPGDVVNLAGAVFIAPYLLLSATAGQLADKLEKSRLIFRIKLLELVIVAVGAAGFLLREPGLLLLMLFGLGAQATLFGPVKYALLPQQLAPRELTGGNGLVETGMYVAILAGTLTGGALIADHRNGALWVAIATVACAAGGVLAARAMPPAAPADPQLAVNWNLFTETARNLRRIRADRPLWWCALANSWFWFFGAVMLAQVPLYCRNELHGDESVATLLLATFSVGIGLGSLACERLSRGRVEPGLVPPGALGMAVCAAALGLWPLPEAGTGPLMGASAFLATAPALPVLGLLLALGAFGGLYIVPVYAFLQSQGDPRGVARVIAANNVLNALFIVVSAFFAMALLRAGLGAGGVYVVLALVHLPVCALLFARQPDFLARWRALLQEMAGPRP